MGGCNIKKINYQTKMQKSNFFEKGRTKKDLHFRQWGRVI